MKDVEIKNTDKDEINLEENKMEENKESLEETKTEEKQKRTRRTKAEIEAERLAKEQERDENTGINIDGELVKELSDEESETKEDVEIPVLELELEKGVIKHKPHKTEHLFAPNDHVFVAEFGQKRESDGFSKLINSYKFYPREGEIERVILTENPIKVQYKLKNRAGSLFDEEDVCFTEEDAQKLCDLKNRR